MINIELVKSNFGGMVYLDGFFVGDAQNAGHAMAMSREYIRKKCKPVSYNVTNDGFKYRTFKGHYPLAVYPTVELAEQARDKHFFGVVRQVEAILRRKWPVVIEGKEPYLRGPYAEYTGPLPSKSPRNPWA
jgi:hypothetical protein